MQTLSYLAAAVSDFTMEPAEHKLQSGGSLELKLVPVQKLLGKVKEWNPRTYLVSFKLETDASLLEQKAKAAIAKYGVDAVVANELKSRRTQVTVYLAKE